MADCSLMLNQALQYVTAATQLDGQGSYREALKQYSLGLDSFISVLKYERNERIVNTIRPKVKAYMKRAEEIQSILDEEDVQAKQMTSLLPSPPKEIGETAAPKAVAAVPVYNPPTPPSYVPPPAQPSTLPPTPVLTRAAPVHQPVYQPPPVVAPVGQAPPDIAKSPTSLPKSIKILHGEYGVTYEKLFGEFLRTNYNEVLIEDPYIRSTHQIYNFLRFCELVVKSNSGVQRIRLITTANDDKDKETAAEQHLAELAESLDERNIQLIIERRPTLHDRQIVLNNGYVIKIGRGLDIYQKARSTFSIGFCDFELRPTLETTVDIYKST
eukprot:TRINITY_DN5276_c0_g1_i1.p1 TRINITY_DN5276_c0_g1~~TRINITY_DN5276_c0_g1_i1.p1  ORF type:complete len:354 (+),score=54.31 TRINITY_DN5276_c0_g1_i1:83-1063(+)